MKRKITKAGVTSKPTSGLKKSGWRTFRPVITENCKGCGICVTHCPEGCIRIEGKRAGVNYDYCKGCLICMNVCPFKSVNKRMEK